MNAITPPAFDPIDAAENLGCDLERIIKTLSMATDQIISEVQHVHHSEHYIYDRIYTRCCALDVAIDLLRVRDSELQAIIRWLYGNQSTAKAESASELEGEPA